MPTPMPTRTKAAIIEHQRNVPERRSIQPSLT